MENSGLDRKPIQMRDLRCCGCCKLTRAAGDWGDVFICDRQVVPCVAEAVTAVGYRFLSAHTDGVRESEQGGGGAEAYRVIYPSDRFEACIHGYLDDYHGSNEKANGRVSYSFTELTMLFERDKDRFLAIRISSEYMHCICFAVGETGAAGAAVMAELLRSALMAAFGTKTAIEPESSSDSRLIDSVRSKLFNAVSYSFRASPPEKEPPKAKAPGTKGPKAEAAGAPERPANASPAVETGSVRKCLTDTMWWSLDHEVLTIGGEGEMPHPTFGFPWLGERIASVIIMEGVLSVGEYAFRSCKHLSKAILPKGLLSIRDGAFQESGLEEITLPEGLTCIGDRAFYACRQLSRVIIPDSVVEIKYAAFENCERLDHVVLPKALKKIGMSAFYRTAIREIDLPDGLETIGRHALSGCSLSHLRIPDSVIRVETPIASPCRAQLPKGREDMPVFDPQTSEDHLRRFAYLFFDARPDVLENPTGDPAKDRFTAIRRLLDITERYFSAKPILLPDSRASSGELFLCGEKEYDYYDSCYDGGCGPSCDITEHGVTYRIITEEDFKKRCSTMRRIQADAFVIWCDKEGKQCVLRHPMGLGDCFSIQSDHALQLPPRTQPKKADPPCVADRPKAIYSSMEKAQSEAELEQIADVFFRGRTFILSKSSGDLTQDRLRAMREILKTVRQLVQRYGAKANDDSLDVSQGKLNYCYQTTDTTCYDGGSYGDWLNQLYLGVEIMDDEALRAAKENAKKDPISGFTQRFRTDHPECGAGTTMFVDRENVYMIHPFDTAINLRFSFFAQ